MLAKSRFAFYNVKNEIIHLYYPYLLVGMTDIKFPAIKTRSGIYFETISSTTTIPNYITHLTINGLINNAFLISRKDGERFIPSSVTHLTFGHLFNYPLDPGDIPDTVTHLTIKTNCIRPRFGVIPNSVTHLIFGDFFVYKFKVGCIPDSVTHLTFNARIKLGIIPKSITHLTFGSNFNYPLKIGFIPNSVTHLVFGRNFNQTLKKGVIPDSVTHLDLGEFFSKPLESGDIPDSVTHLAIGEFFYQLVIPNSITHFKFRKLPIANLHQGDIPNSVTHIVLKYHFNKPLEQGVIPDSVVYIKFNSGGLEVKEYEKPLEYLSEHVFIDKNLQGINLYTSNKWTRYTCKYFDNVKIYQDIFHSKLNSGILDELPNELLFYLLEYL